MNKSFFNNVGENQEGLFMATAADVDVDVFHPLNEVEEEYSISFSPLNYPYNNYYLETMFDDDDYNNMVEFFQDHQDMDINISDSYPILNDIDDPMMISRNDTNPLPLPTKEIFMDNKEVILFHLVMAYKEAMEMGQEDLAEVIEKRIGDKVSPVGDTSLERLMYYVFGSLEYSHDYLKQESLKNFFPAFETFYQIFPNGKFAHFVANSAILEALPNPNSFVVIRIFDLDIGEGIQWSSLIGSIISNPQQKRMIREVIITSVKLDHDDDDHHHQWKLEDTKRRLCDDAMLYGLKLRVEEIELRNLERCLINIEEMVIREELYEWFVFNCMVGLPHMGRVRSRRKVVEFLNSSQNFLKKSKNNNNKNNGLERWGGIVIVGDGDSWEKVKNAGNYGAYLDGNMAHYQALLESIKCNFPIGLGEARVAMECLFVAPFVSSRRWAKQWEEKKKKKLCYDLEPGLEGWKLREESVMEARELVVRCVEGDEYGVRRIIDGHQSSIRNEIVMDWRGIPLVKVSCWRSN